MNDKDTYNQLRELVAIDSVFPKENELSIYLSRQLSRHGFKVQKVSTQDRRNNIVATFGPAKKYLGFYGHIDTVEADRHYKADPLTARRKGDKVQGLGVADMKGGITATLSLAEFASAQKLPVKLVFGVDEENISAGAHDLVGSGLMDNIDFLISAESGQIGDTPQAYNVCYGRRGRVVIGIKINGQKAHAAESHNAVNAIEEAVLFLSNLNRLSFPKSPNFGTAQSVVSEISGATGSFSVPDECSFTASILTTPAIKQPQVLSQLKRLAKNLNIAADIRVLPRATSYSESYEVDRSNKFLQTLETTILNPAGIRPGYSNSVADENIFANRLSIPVISIGPVAGGDHTADEWVSLKSIERVSDVYKRILVLHNS